MPDLINIVGNRYGRLVVMGRAPNKGRSTAWNCLCDCGNTAIVASQDLRKGHTKSCGCLHRESFQIVGRSNKKHGEANSRLYKTWSAMKVRCNDKNSPSFKDYGGRGIRVCDEWKEFTPFYMWAIRNGYSDELTLDRIDVNGDYEPSNCRWTTQMEQSNNKRNNHFVSIGGVTHTIAEWSRISGISKVTIRSRLEKGWSAKNAVFHPPLRIRRKFYESK